LTPLGLEPRVRGKAAGNSRGERVMHLRDGKVTEFWSYPAVQHEADGFWS
jgi:hypothetical protein